MATISSNPSSENSFLESRNPATSALLAQIPIPPLDEVATRVARARAAQSNWGTLPVALRARQVKKFRDEMARRVDEICSSISQETGKPKLEAMLMEAFVVLDSATYFIKRAHKILARQTISLHLLKHSKSYLHYSPRGVVGIISPWNFPFSLPMCEVVMALLAGNAVILKPSEITTGIALKAKELYDASGLPRDLFQILPGRGDMGNALIENGIDYCIFTGSAQTGRKVAAACGERLIPHVLELGGKTAALVCADADIARTAKALVWGAFANSGQVCVSIERAFVHKNIHDKLVEAILKEVKSLRQGNPAEQEVDVGSMTWQKQREIVEEHVKTARAQGATIRIGGMKPNAPGLFYPPTVLTDCKPDMDIMRREIFGPLLPIMKISNEEEGIRLCNASRAGLMSYVFTNDTRKGRHLAEQLQTGMIMVNDVLNAFAAPETPWGGIRDAGIGQTHSDQGLRDLCYTHHINYDRFRFKRDPWWFPYTNKLYQRMRKFVKFWF